MFLKDNDEMKSYVEPDISVICDPDKIDDKLSWIAGLDYRNSFIFKQENGLFQES